MRRLYLARHGETEWNAIGRLQGHTDIPLNEQGRVQALALAAALVGEGIASVVTSDLARAHETGAIVARTLGLAGPHIVPALRERGFGVFEGLTREQCLAQYPVAWRAWLDQRDVPEGAESLEDATLRMHRALETLVEDEGGPALVVSHGGIMRLWLIDVLREPIAPLHNGVTYVVERSGRRWTARLHRED